MREDKILLHPNQTKDLLIQLTDLLKPDFSLTERLYRCRQLLESLYKFLTHEVNIAFTGLYARMQYIHEEAQVIPILVDQLQNLRLFTNKVIHKDAFDFGEKDFLSCIRILSEALEYFSGSKLTGEIRQFLLHNPSEYFSSIQADTESTISSLHGVVEAWHTSSSRQSTKYLEIKCRIPDGRRISITLWEKGEGFNPGRNWTLLDKALWKYCNISFYELAAIPGQANRFQSTHQTLVTLEPDFLLDVSAIAECFQKKDYYPELFIINKFFSDVSTPALGKGKYVNFVFDELIADPQADLTDLSDHFLAEHPMLEFALGKETWEQIFADIRSVHYPQLKQIALELTHQDCQLEPSFISLMYGLHGRLDVMTLPRDENGKYNIIELKSGSAPDFDIWRSHQMQVVGYNLILKEIYSAQKIANSSIFYSRSADSPLRHVVNHVTLEQNFLMCRNRIIGITQKLATSPQTFVDWLKTNSRIYPGQFITDKVNTLRRVLSTSSPAEYQWFCSKLQFIFKEIWAVKTGAFDGGENTNYGFSALWNSSNAEKKNQYKIIDGLWLESINEDIVIFTRQEDDAIANLREGDIVLLYNEKQPANRQQLLRGTILSLETDKIVVKTRSKLKCVGQFDTYTQWAIEPDLMESSLYSGLASIFMLLSADQHKRAILLGASLPSSTNADTRGLLSWREDVKSALQGMLCARDYYLVQGPPGTGKTSCLLMQYVQFMLTDSEKKLILLSYTNRSVDEICSRLTEQQITFIRFGNQSHLNQEEKSQSLPFSEISRCRIFVSTLSSFSAISADVMQHLKLDELIVDEASQITEHSIIGLMSSLPKTILVGDQNQLPPVILHQTDETHLSIFEKLSHYAEQNTGFSLLTTHYRMHEAVAGLVNTAYGNKLQAGSDRQKTLDMWLKPSDAYLQILLEHRIIWIDTLSTGQSKVDQMQAEWIGNFLEKLLPFLPEGRAADCVGIISPFRAQVQCIRNRLSQQTHSFTIDTVERYQGSERDCIIVSYPLRYAYELGMIQSLSQDGCLDRKLNVALSRAREQIIILGNSQVLTQSIHFKLVYEYIKEHGSVVNL